MTDQSLASSVPGVEHWRGQPGVWPAIRQCGGRRQPNYRPIRCLVSRRPPNYRCPCSSALSASSAFFSTTLLSKTNVRACSEIDIYVLKWTVPIFCMYQKWLYQYWDLMYQNWLYRKKHAPKVYVQKLSCTERDLPRSFHLWTRNVANAQRDGRPAGGGALCSMPQSLADAHY